MVPFSLICVKLANTYLSPISNKVDTSPFLALYAQRINSRGLSKPATKRSFSLMFSATLLFKPFPNFKAVNADASFTPANTSLIFEYNACEVCELASILRSITPTNICLSKFF